MDPHLDEDVERGSVREEHDVEKELPRIVDSESEPKRESRVVVEEPEPEEMRKSFCLHVISPVSDVHFVLGRVPITHDAVENLQLQELQRELSEFLGQHIAKTMALQNSLHDPLKLGMGRRAFSFERENTSVVSPPSTGNIAVYHQDHAPLSRLSLGVNGPRPYAVNWHNETLDRFLTAHINNLQAFQDSLQRGNNEKIPSAMIPASHFDLGGRDSQYSGSMQEFAALIATMLLEGILIMVFLSFTHTMIGSTKHRLPFSVAMLFSFFCLSLLLLGLSLSLWGMVAASWRHLKNDPESQVQINFHLFLSRQLQFCAAVGFILPVLLLTFYIFDGIAFPVVNLVFMLVASLLVLGSVVYRVPISLENVGSIVLSTRHMERPSLKPVGWNNARRRSIY